MINEEGWNKETKIKWEINGYHTGRKDRRGKRRAKEATYLWVSNRVCWTDDATWDKGAFLPVVKFFLRSSFVVLSQRATSKVLGG